MDRRRRRPVSPAAPPGPLAIGLGVCGAACRAGRSANWSARFGYVEKLGYGEKLGCGENGPRRPRPYRALVSPATALRGPGGGLGLGSRAPRWLAPSSTATNTFAVDWRTLPPTPRRPLLPALPRPRPRLPATGRRPRGLAAARLGWLAGTHRPTAAAAGGPPPRAGSAGTRAGDASALPPSGLPLGPGRHVWSPHYPRARCARPAAAVDPPAGRRWPGGFSPRYILSDPIWVGKSCATLEVSKQFSWGGP
jgi:hypothetical protein